MPEAIEHVDVLIVGAGLSGVGAGCHLIERCPGKSFAILEAREAIGGTWDLFRYPGVRSDSDMFTLGYSFAPWRSSKAIGDGPSILRYVRDTAARYGVDKRIRFHHRVVRAEWSSADARWTVEAQRTDTGETVLMTCGWLSLCSGYYRYDEGYTPEFPGIERFGGQIVHPQHWDEDVDYRGRRVVVIGSGATAVTLVPAMAGEAQHVTMLQRSPSYIISLPARDPVLLALRRVMPRRWAYSIVRWKNVLVTMLIFQLSRRRPEAVKKLLRRGLEKQLPAGYDIDTHFKPTYNPWDQRMCLVPDGDLLQAIGEGGVSIETGKIATFTETGIELESGKHLDADLVVTATGLNLIAFGGARLAVDGREVDISRALTYKGMMLSDVPNMSFTFGYTNASWTLKADLTARFTCRLLAHMDENGFAVATPALGDQEIARAPFIDLSSGYVQRAVADWPKQGPEKPWRQYQNYLLDMVTLRLGAVDDGVIQFAGAPAVADAPEPVAA
jgi:monooxygenase